MNSAWACQDNNDESNILLGEYQIRETLASVEDSASNLVIALVHHPFHHLKPFDAKQAKQILFNHDRCQFVLRGHLHEAEFEGVWNPGGVCAQLAAGACWQDAEHPHSVLAVQLNLTTKKCTVFAWAYEPNHGGFWVPDNRLYPNMVNGQWEFDLPKSWEKRIPTPETAAVDTTIGPLVPPRYRDYLAQEFGTLETLVENETPLVFRLQKVYVPLQTDWVDPAQKKSKQSKEPSNPLHFLAKEKNRIAPTSRRSFRHGFVQTDFNRRRPGKW